LRDFLLAPNRFTGIYEADFMPLIPQVSGQVSDYRSNTTKLLIPRNNY
jgi:hypothetical protein